MRDSRCRGDLSHYGLLYRRVLHRPDREPVEPIVVVGWIDCRRIEVQVLTVRLRVERRTPVVPVRASVVEPRTVTVARGGEETQVDVGANRTAHAEQSSTHRVGGVVRNVNGVGCYLIRCTQQNAEAQAAASLCFFTPPTEV